jgi:hypothetical protein
MLRLWAKESDLDICALWDLSLLGLLFESPKLGSSHLFCAINELRIMKVGGNESATKFFQSNGGTAALNSKDPTTKYTSNAATKYKEELKRRSAKDATE